MQKIRHKCNLLDSAEEKKDDIEQEHLHRFNLVPVLDMDQYYNDMDLDIDLDMDTDINMKGLDDDDLYDDLYDRGDKEIGDTGTFTGPGDIPDISARHPSESGSLERPSFHPDGKLLMPGRGCSSP